jgi:hypothetical protein
VDGSQVVVGAPVVVVVVVVGPPVVVEVVPTHRVQLDLSQ